MIYLMLANGFEESEALVSWDMLRRKKIDKEKQKDTDALLAELEALRALKAEKEKQEQA